MKRESKTVRNIRVANIIEDGRLAGPQIRMSMVAAALKGRVDTTIIMPELESEAFCQRCEDLGIEYKTLSITRVTTDWKIALKYLCFSFREIYHLAKFLKRRDFDLVHVSGGCWQIKGILASNLARKKVIWHLNDTGAPWIFLKLFRLINPLADGFIYAANRAKRFYKPYLSGKYQDFLIPPPTNTSHFDPSYQYLGDEELIESWKGKIVIGTIANINPIKGLEVFLDAANCIANNQKSVQFVIVGPVYNSQRQYFEHLKALCTKPGLWNVDFVGSRTDIRPLLSRFDIFVCSSHSETGPMTLWEAMAMRKCAVSTDVGDVSTYINNVDNGFIVEVGNSQSLADKLTFLIDNPSTRLEFGKNAQKTILDNLDVQQCADMHLNAYKSIVYELH